MQIQMWDVSQAETIIRFNRKCFLTNLWKPEDWRELPADPMAIYYGAVNMDTGAPAVNLFIYNRQGEKDYIKIMNPGVHPNRGQGLAHRLPAHAAREMAALGMKRFCGESRASNQAMRKVFEACGCRLEQTEAGYYADSKEIACKYALRLG